MSNTLLQSAAIAPAAAPFAAPTGRGASHIIVVEDDAPLRALMARLLRECGYDVTGVGDGRELREAMNRIGAPPVDLILLDIMLPGDDGLSICRKIRETSAIPIIVVSARGQEADRVKGLDLGADDYIAKPFGRPELLARVRALLRRADAAHSSQDAFVPSRFDFAGWTYHARRRELVAPTGAEVMLTAAEYELLLTLLRNPQRTISRERLLELVRSRIGNANDRSIDVLISRLRGKMGGARKASPIIRTVRGVGYMFAADVEAA